jgi:putative transposase
VGSSYETVRRWGRKFGPDYAHRLHRKRPSPNVTRHLDEVIISIAGKSTGSGPPSIRTGMCSTKLYQAGAIPRLPKRLLTRLMRKQGVAPKRIITDKLSSYGAARRRVMPRVEHRSHKGLNNRAENSHVPLQKRERVMQSFRSAGARQRFTSVVSAVRNLFVPPRSNRTAFTTHLHRLQAMAAWKAAAGILA